MRRSIKAALVVASLLVGSLPVLPANADVIALNFRRVGGNNSSNGGHIVFEGDRMYMGMYGVGFRTFDISDPRSPRLLGEFNPRSPRADATPDAAIWDGRHIVAFGGTNRTSVPQQTGQNTQKSEFFDMTNPASPVLLHTWFGAPDGEAHNSDIFDAKRLWLPSGSGGDNGLRIYDLQPLLDNPPDPPPAPGTNTPNANDPVRLWPPDDCRNDAAVLCDPVTLWQNSPYRGDQPVGPAFDHTHDVTIYPNHPVQQPDGSFKPRDIVLLAEGGRYATNAVTTNTGSAFVIDITDPTKPVVLYRWLHSSGARHHPIRYPHEAIFIEGKPNLMVVSDEDLHNGCGDAGGVVAVQLSPDLQSGVEQSEWFIPPATPAPVCSAHVFTSAGNLLFMGAYNAGTVAIDYSNPQEPKLAGHYQKEGTAAWGAYYHNGYVYQGDTSNGLDVLQFLGPIPGLAASVARTCPGFARSPRPQFVGSRGADQLAGSRKAEVFCGLEGNDRIRGGGGRDIVIAGTGNDRVSGGTGRDWLRGAGGADRLRGGPGKDRCVGGRGPDWAKCERERR